MDRNLVTVFEFVSASPSDQADPGTAPGRRSWICDSIESHHRRVCPSVRADRASARRESIVALRENPHRKYFGAGSQDLHHIRRGPRHPHFAFLLFEQGMFFQETGDCARSEKMFVRALQIAQETLGSEHSFTGKTWAALGMTYTCLGQYVKAESSLKRSLSIIDKRANLTVVLAN